MMMVQMNPQQQMRAQQAGNMPSHFNMGQAQMAEAHKQMESIYKELGFRFGGQA